MITKYEVHIKTKHTLFELLRHMESQGVSVDFKLMNGDCGELMVRMPSDTKIHCFAFKFYKHEGDMYTYELGSHNKECLPYMEEISRMLD